MSGSGVDYALRQYQLYQQQQQQQNDEDATTTASRRAKSVDPFSDSTAAGTDVNGEVVRGEIEKFQTAEAWRAGVSGLAFAMGVVGIWGERTLRYR